MTIHTIAEIDRRLTACRVAYIDALDHDDEITADAMSDTMDELFEERAHHKAEH